MFESVLKSEVKNVTIELFKNTSIKDYRKSKNYICTFYKVYPEDSTLKTLTKQTFWQAWKHYFKMFNALKEGTEIYESR